MGRLGSGRWHNYQKRDIVDYSLTLSIDALVKAGLNPCQESSGLITLKSPQGDPVKASLDYRLEPRLRTPILTLGYSVGEDPQIVGIGLQKTSFRRRALVVHLSIDHQRKALWT